MCLTAVVRVFFQIPDFVACDGFFRKLSDVEAVAVTIGPFSTMNLLRDEFRIRRMAPVSQPSRHTSEVVWAR